MALKVAALQITSGPSTADNLAMLTPLIAEAAAAGAQFIALPENCVRMVQGRSAQLAEAYTPENHPAIRAFAALAKQHKVWILAGSIAVLVEPERFANRCYLFAPTGAVAATYDKIHLFDVQLANGETYRESALFTAGDKAVVVETDFGKLGLTICYDIRFPHLYRALAKAGAAIITVPAAFTVPTGQAHWESLLRARAIETGAFIIAPAQCGTHDAKRKTYGHAMIISPWGEVLAMAGAEPTILYASLDLAKVQEARQMIPSLQHDRPFTGP